MYMENEHSLFSDIYRQLQDDCRLQQQTLVFEHNQRQQLSVKYKQLYLHLHFLAHKPLNPEYYHPFFNG